MINQTSEESITTASPSAEKETRQPSRSQKLSGKSFDFLWKRDSRRENGSKREENQWKREDLIEVKIVECKLNPPTKNASTSKMSFDFFRNIKKHMQIRSIMMCKSKQKAKEICTSGPQNVTNQESLSLYNDRPICIQENNLVESRSNNSRASDVSCNDESSNLAETPSHSKHTSRLVNEILQRCSDIERNNEVVCEEFSGKTEVSHNNESIYNEHRSCSSNERQEVQYNVAIGNTLMEQKADSVEKIVAQTENGEATFNDNRIKTSLTEELLKLSKYGWYWGPISGNEADAKLISEPDGAFLVRDSSDDRYVLTLSFKSSGKLLHARMEHSGGLFSLCNQCESEGFTSVAALINHSMNFSQPFCYSRPKYPGYPSFPVRLTKPVSRFTQVRSLQYLCRFVIRQNTRLDNIHKLPLPKTIKGYIEEAHY